MSSTGKRPSSFDQATVENKATKGSRCSSPSASATPESGFFKLNERLRSPLRSPFLSLPLIRLLNEDAFQDSNNLRFPSKNLYDDNKDVLKNIQVKGAGVFRQAVQKWDGTSEKKFTDKYLLDELKKFCSSDNASNPDSQESQESTHSTKSETSVAVKVGAQVFLSGNNSSFENAHQRGSSDILLFERNSEDRAVGHPICLIEIGRQEKYDWWEKVCQGHDYVSMMRNPTGNAGIKHYEIEKHKFGQYPMLLTSIIIHKNGKENKDGKENEDVSGDFGLFLCVPVSSTDEQERRIRDYRAIFLWRERIQNSVEKASQAFGKVLQASYALQMWRGSILESDFQYLGPNCAKIGDRLYRSYDTRLRATNRSPELYLPPPPLDRANSKIPGEKKKEEDKQLDNETNVGFHWYPQDDNDETRAPEDEVGIMIFDAKDSAKDRKKPILCFGDSLPRREGRDGPEFQRDWLWEQRGRLLIISVPYRPGDHVATKLSDFEPIFRHLKYIHSFDRVHGDVRGFNMVFAMETEEKRSGWMIDFDFGGKLGEKKYPTYYKKKLDDGFRLGVGGKTITKFHDYYALWMVIDAYIIITGGDVLNAKNELMQFFEDKDNERKFQEAQTLLSDFLTQYPETKLKARRPFLDALEELSPPLDDNNKNDESPTRNANTNKNVATGSLRA